jgi:excisionase family DNA binding protein
VPLPDITDIVLLRPAEVAHALHVDPKTVNRWANTGKLHAIRTPGGQRRFFKSDIDAILSGKTFDERDETDDRTSEPDRDTHP